MPSGSEKTLKQISRSVQLHSWIALEHARLHLVAAWPASVRKETLLEAIRSSIGRLMMDPDANAFRCFICKEPANVLPFSHRSRPITSLHDVAA